MKQVLSILVIFLIAAYTCNRIVIPVNQYEIWGIDVSHYQSSINWDTVASSGVDFVFVKATEGITLHDSLFTKNWSSLHRIGLNRGAYHFFRPTSSPSEQADHFIRNVPYQVGDMPPVLDVEVLDGVSKVDLLTGMYTWLYKVEIAYGVKPIIYTNQKFYNKYLSGHFKEYPLWIARYSSREPRLKDGRKWDFWQYGSHGKVEGIEGYVDFNFFSNTLPKLQEISIHPSAARRNPMAFPARSL